VVVNASSWIPRWPGWRHLPRDARDTLFLLGVIAWTLLPHFDHLPWWCAALTTLVLAWRAHLALANAPLPNRWVLIAVLTIAAGLTWWTERTLLGKEAGVTLLAVLMALKTLELRARRDAFVVFFLGFFLVLTQFLYSQTLFTAAAMIVAVWGLLTALVLAHMPVGQPSLRQAGALSARAAALGAPLMALLFVLFPRLDPLWGLPSDAAASTGLSSTMTMGSVAEVANDDSIALRVRFAGDAPPPQAMYFRGPVLGAFDGREWKRLEPRLPEIPATGEALRVRGPAYAYEMTLEPLRLTVLPLLEMSGDETPPRVEGYRVRRRDDLQWATERLLTDRVRLSTSAHLDYTQGPTRGTPSLRDYLELPAGFNPRTRAWAEQLRAQPAFAHGDAGTLARAVLQHVRRGGFSYTLAPGTYGDAAGHDTIDEFWLDRKRGFCEHFAAAFVVVMRAMDVPARVVTGYQGSDPRPVDGYYIVRQSHAHAWAEYWQAGRGWLRADPTAAVAPERIVRSASLRPRLGLVAGALNNVSPNLLVQLRAGWEAINNRWNQWVLNYTRTQQFELLRNLGIGSPSWEDLALLLLQALVAISFAGAAWAWWDRRRVDPWTRLHERLRRTLATLGVASAAHHAPRALAHAVRAQLGAAGESLAALLDNLDRQRYARDGHRLPDAGWSRRFAREAAQLRPKGHESGPLRGPRG
jgi:transglutaminase-like putative cysteine protease